MGRAASCSRRKENHTHEALKCNRHGIMLFAAKCAYSKEEAEGIFTHTARATGQTANSTLSRIDPGCTVQRVLFPQKAVSR